MRTMTSTFLLILFTWHSCFALEPMKKKIPFEIKKYKVTVEFHHGEKSTGYLVNATTEYLYLVQDKSEVEDALLHNCLHCQKINVNQVSNIKTKKSILGTLVGISAVILTLGLLVLSRDNENGESPSERWYAYIFYSPIAAGIIGIMVFYSLKSKNLYKVADFKKHSSLYDYAKKKTTSLRKFYSNPFKKKYRFYLDGFTTIVDGHLVSMDDTHLYLHISHASSLGIEKTRIEYIE